jgi:hypothetical protein
MKTRRGTKKQQEEISEGGGVSVCIKKFFPRGRIRPPREEHQISPIEKSGWEEV